MDRIAKIANKIAGSSGDELHDIDITCFYDTFLSQEDFNENFKVLSRDHRGDADVLLFDNSEKYPEDILEVVDYELFGETFGEEYSADYRYVANNWYANNIVKAISTKCSLSDMSKACEEEFENWDDLVEWIKDNDEYAWDTYDWLWEVLPKEAQEAVYDEAKKNISFPDWQTLLGEINFWRGDDFSTIGLSLKTGWTWFKSHGYSQGDACVVICDSGENTTAIEHMIWDAPLTCYVTIDGDEYYVDSELKDPYDYDKDEAIGIVKKQLGDKLDQYISDYLDINMPDQPEYM